MEETVLQFKKQFLLFVAIFFHNYSLSLPFIFTEESQLL